MGGLVERARNVRCEIFARWAALFAAEPAERGPNYFVASGIFTLREATPAPMFHVDRGRGRFGDANAALDAIHRTRSLTTE